MCGVVRYLAVVVSFLMLIGVIVCCALLCVDCRRNALFVIVCLLFDVVWCVVCCSLVVLAGCCVLYVAACCVLFAGVCSPGVAACCLSF